MTNFPIKPGVTITKTLIWNKVESEYHDKDTEVEITFSNGKKYPMNVIDLLI